MNFEGSTLRQKPVAAGHVAAFAVVMLIFWALSVMGIFTEWDGFLYDQAFRLYRTANGVNSHVTLVDIPPGKGNIDAATTLTLVKNLQAFKPAGIILNYIPANMTDEEINQLEQCRNIIIGIHVDSNSNEGDIKFPGGNPVPQPIQASKLKTGITRLPFGGGSIMRLHHSWFRINNTIFPSVEMTAALFWYSEKTLNRSPSVFRVNFRGGAGSLPSISMDRVLKNDLVSPLIENQFILIGNGIDSSTPGIPTPLARGTGSMSFLEYQGHALNSLLNLQVITQTGTWFDFLLFFIITGVMFVLYQRVYLKFASWLTLFLILLYAAIAIMVLFFLRVWIPLGQVVLLQVILLFISAQNKNLSADQTFETLLLDLNAKLRERYYPTSIYLVKEHWKQVISMVVQTLTVNRLIFLERIEKDHRVKEVVSYKCDFSDIDERRRDYLRSPYSDAIQANGPILLNNFRIFLKPGKSNEEQYLVPLSFAGNILGFWAFEILPENRLAIPMFNTLVRDYASSIGELLYNRKEIQQQEKQKGGVLSFFTREREKQTHDALAQTFELLRHQFDNLSRVFFSLNTMTIAYDLFGRVLEVNGKMLEFLKTENIAPYDTTLVDLFSKLSRIPVEEGRKILRSVVNDRTPQSLNLQHGLKNFIITLKPLEFTEGIHTYIDAAPFGINGVVCEITETTTISQFQDVKEKFSEHLSSSMYIELQALSEIFRALEGDSLPRKEQLALVKKAEKTLDRALGVVDSSESFLFDSGFDEEIPVAFPVNPQTPLLLAVHSVESASMKKGITVDTETSPNEQNVMAHPEYLHHVFVYILSILVDDTLENGTITVRRKDEPEWSHFVFTNTGYGIPKEKLNQMIESTESLSTEWRKLKISIDWIRQWGGKLDAHSEIGVGFRFTLSLSRFI